MELKQWLYQNPPGDIRAGLLNRVGCRIMYLHQVAGGHKRASAMRAKQIEEATRELTPHAVVTRAELRPDLFG